MAQWRRRRGNIEAKKEMAAYGVNVAAWHGGGMAWQCEEKMAAYVAKKRINISAATRSAARCLSGAPSHARTGAAASRNKRGGAVAHAKRA